MFDNSFGQCCLFDMSTCTFYHRCLAGFACTILFIPHVSTMYLHSLLTKLFGPVILTRTCHSDYKYVPCFVNTESCHVPQNLHLMHFPLRYVYIPAHLLPIPSQLPSTSVILQPVFHAIIYFVVLPLIVDIVPDCPLILLCRPICYLLPRIISMLSLLQQVLLNLNTVAVGLQDS